MNGSPRSPSVLRSVEHLIGEPNDSRGVVGRLVFERVDAGSVDVGDGLEAEVAGLIGGELDLLSLWSHYFDEGHFRSFSAIGHAIDAIGRRRGL